jgi:hypothetical protein
VKFKSCFPEKLDDKDDNENREFRMYFLEFVNKLVAIGACVGVGSGGDRVVLPP